MEVGAFFVFVFYFIFGKPRVSPTLGLGTPKRISAA